MKLFFLHSISQWHASSIVDWNQGTFQWFFSPFKLALEKSTLSLVEKRNPSNLELHP
jgi:hypothetical protein